MTNKLSAENGTKSFQYIWNSHTVIFGLHLFYNELIWIDRNPFNFRRLIISGKRFQEKLYALKLEHQTTTYAVIHYICENNNSFNIDALLLLYTFFSFLKKERFQCLLLWTITFYFQRHDAHPRRINEKFD